MILITDLDHTLAAAAWRDDFRGDWDTYHLMSREDQPIQPMVALVNALSLTATIICITTRPERWRSLTMIWLLRHKVDIDELLMRPNDDFRPSPELKVALAQPYLTDENVVAIDDRADVLQAYRAVGIKGLLQKL